MLASVSAGGLEHGEVETDEAVAAADSLERVNIIATLDVGDAVEDVLGADAEGVVNHTMSGVEDGEVEVGDAVAAAGVGESHGRRGGAVGVGVAVNPCHAVAHGVVGSTLVAVVDREMQRVDAGTSVGIDVRVAILSTDGVTGAVPSIDVASGDNVGMVSAVVDGEVESIDALDAKTIGVAIEVASALSVFLVVPYEAVAGRHGLGAVATATHGEVECIDAGTSVFGEIVVDVCT